MIRWSAITEFVFHIGVIGQAAYLADPGRRAVGLWPFVGLVLLPFLILLFIRHGELPDSSVARAHLLAALWYLVLTGSAVALTIGGFRPPGWIMFLVSMAPGTLISLLLLYDRLRDPPSPGLPAER